jgi:hypothetical protein
MQTSCLYNRFCRPVFKKVKKNSGKELTNMPVTEKFLSKAERVCEFIHFEITKTKTFLLLSGGRKKNFVIGELD